MYKINNKYFTFFALVGICFFHTNTIVLATEKKLATSIADAYLKSFPAEVISKQETATKKSKKFDVREHGDIKLSDTARRTVVFNEVFAQSSTYDQYDKKTTDVLNPYAWKDLHLFCGSTTTPGFHLMSRINKTITTLGEGALATLLATPTSDIHEIQKRQEIIKFLINEKGIYEKIKETLTSYSSVEKSMLSFWTATDPLYTKEYNKYMDDRFYTKNIKTDKSASSLQWRKILYRDYWNIVCDFTYYPTIGGLGAGIASCFMKKGRSGDDVGPIDIFFSYLPFWNIRHTHGIIKKRKEKFEAKKVAIEQETGVKYGGSSNSHSLMSYLGPIAISAHSLWQYYRGYKNYQEYAGALRNLARRMASVQAFIHAIDKVNNMVLANPQLETIYGAHLVAIQELLALTNQSSQIGEFLKNLKNMPLKSWSYFFNHGGKLLASHKLFIAHKNMFHNAMYELGTLDAFVGIATLMESTKEKGAPHTYNFTQFLSRQQKGTPYIKIDAMWNPFLEPTIAVGNSVVMDGGAKGGMRNMIITGPNAGGKSTFLTGVTNAILLSQVFGIAPAQALTMTPFDKINTYIDVTDDIAAGKSLFMAEVERFLQHLNLLKPLKNNEFSFTIFDEPFSGTNPREGEAAEYSVLDYISRYKNALNIVATHYPIVMLLEKKVPEKGFKNYKVFINHHGRGKKIDYTYKVVPGESNQAIAIDILEEQGYDTTILEQAKDILANPEKYGKSF